MSSGLFLGWSLGANDAANVFGSAVGSKMISFKKATIIAGIFVIIGAVVQGYGASDTLCQLGQINALAGSFTVALSAAITVFFMTRMKIPVSTSQAIVGAIIGWNFYSGNATDYNSLGTIVFAWLLGPVLGALFAIILFLLLKKILLKSKIHLLRLDASIRFALIIIGAFGAYSLGANNIANVMGVFIDSINIPSINFFNIIVLSGTQQLFFIGGLAIAIGILTYSKKVIKTIGNNILSLTSETAMVVVLSQALVLFIFSSQSLASAMKAIGLPAFPLVPVSSSQIIVGAILGIGLLKRAHEINLKTLGQISMGWIATPLIACIIAFFSLFVVNNVFKQEVFKTKITVKMKSNNDKRMLSDKHLF